MEKSKDRVMGSSGRHEVLVSSDGNGDSFFPSKPP